MKCDICNGKIETTFLSKILGTQVRDKKGKKHPVCQACQQKHSMEEIKSKLK